MTLLTLLTLSIILIAEQREASVKMIENKRTASQELYIWKESVKNVKSVMQKIETVKMVKLV